MSFEVRDEQSVAEYFVFGGELFGRRCVTRFKVGGAFRGMWVLRSQIFGGVLAFSNYEVETLEAIFRRCERFGGAASKLV